MSLGRGTAEGPGAEYSAVKGESSRRAGASGQHPCGRCSCCRGCCSRSCCIWLATKHCAPTLSPLQVLRGDLPGAWAGRRGAAGPVLLLDLPLPTGLHRRAHCGWVCTDWEGVRDAGRDLLAHTMRPASCWVGSAPAGAAGGGAVLAHAWACTDRLGCAAPWAAVRCRSGHE